MKFPRIAIWAAAVGVLVTPALAADTEMKNVRKLESWDFSRVQPFVYEYKDGKESHRENRVPEGIGANVWSPQGAGIIRLSREEGPGRGAVAIINLDATKSTQLYTTGPGEVEVKPGRVYVVEVKYSNEGRGAPILNYRLRSIGEIFEFKNVPLDKVLSSSAESPRELGQVMNLPSAKNDEVVTFRGGFEVLDGGATLGVVIYNAAQGDRNPVYIHELTIGDAGPSPTKKKP